MEIEPQLDLVEEQKEIIKMIYDNCGMYIYIVFKQMKEGKFKHLERRDFDIFLQNLIEEGMLYREEHVKNYYLTHYGFEYVDKVMQLS